MPTDEELIAEFLHGSQAAMEVLVKRYYRPVFAFLYRKTGDYHAACDLAQETFIRVLKTLRGYRPSGRFGNWVIKIAVNLSRDYFRSRTYAERSGGAEYSEGAGCRVSSIFESELECRQIRAAVLALPENQRDAVLLYYYSGYKIREIARLTGVREATVKSRIHQAVGKLRKILLGGEQNAQL